MSDLPATITKLLPAHAKLLKLLGQAREVIENEIPASIEKTKRLPLSDAARFFVAYKDIKDEFEELFKYLDAQYTEFKTLTYPAMAEDDGQTSVPLTEGYRVGVSAKLYASIKGPFKKQAYDWLTKNDLGEIIVETVNASTLSASAKARLEEDFLDLPPEFFNVMLQSNTSVTKTKK
jgi:hypothetical protein